ncbi:MAG: hypothetical protein IJ017_03695 [Oscillospiraceae bacterium]|nr:hypothetical protein [Oscillospiraceae bacterium]
MGSIRNYIKEFKELCLNKPASNTVCFSDGSTAKFSVGMVYFTDSEEVIGKYRKVSESPDNYVVECNGERIGTLVLEGRTCRIIGCGKLTYTARRNMIRDMDGTVIAWYNGDAVGAAAAFLCLK